jgi:hypothetical protein|uniref:Uncharacterized protein n=2 Tax=Picea TaxID=3328 RepID=A0A117NGT6_PICGL|nr:hypothetical protein ABT39_MTgene5500 [Picea glauca]QHR91564.1 hypothetical protein Q903MT_gene5599 [Picea sitchensis]
MAVGEGVVVPLQGSYAKVQKRCDKGCADLRKRCYDLPSDRFLKIVGYMRNKAGPLASLNKHPARDLV